LGYPANRYPGDGINGVCNRGTINAGTTPSLTPLILWKLPTDFLPILLGDYLTKHFLLYGALTSKLCSIAATLLGNQER
jgi:hypothetical protein